MNVRHCFSSISFEIQFYQPMGLFTVLTLAEAPKSGAGKKDEVLNPINRESNFYDQKPSRDIER